MVTPPTQTALLLDAYRELVAAQDNLLVRYRLQANAGTALDRLARARATVARLVQ